MGNEREILTVTIGQETGRIDKVLAEKIPELSRSALVRLIEEGNVTCEGLPLTKKTKLLGGEVLTIQLPAPTNLAPIPQNIPLDIVYEDEDVLVINKPVGLVVHPAPGHPDGTLVNALLFHCGDNLSNVGGENRPGIVHRIDRDTSGLLIVAKNNVAHEGLAAQLADHTLARTYECITVGNLKEDEGTIIAPIGRSRKDRKKMAVVSDGREAVTHYTVLRRYTGFGHVQCQLETGRTHQIRVHFAHLGHPILGDTVYGAKKPVKGLTGQCLHASGLQFIHPRTGNLVELTCPLPEEFTAMLHTLEMKERNT